MSFNILLRVSNSVIPERIVDAMEGMPFTLLSYDELMGAEQDEGGGGFEAVLENTSFCALINFIPDDVSRLSEHDVDAAGLFAAASQRFAIPFIQLSSYRVFPEEAQVVSGAGEDLAPEPDTELGQRLLSIEQRAAQADRHLIVRLADIIGFAEGCVFERVLPLVIAQSSAPLSDRCCGTPVSLDFIVQSLVAIIQQVLCGAQSWGVFHLRSSDPCSEAEIADYVVRYLNAERDRAVKLPLIAPESAEPQIFANNARLAGRRLTDCFGIQFPSWRHGLKKRLSNWLKEQNY